jgi:hypothetical protein
VVNRQAADLIDLQERGVREHGEASCELSGRLRFFQATVNIRGNSYRMREHTELYRALQSDVENSAEAGR